MFLNKFNDIRIGDEVISDLGSKLIITSYGSNKGDWCCIDKNGCVSIITIEKIERYNWRKTGNHFPQIEKMLKLLQEEDLK